MVSIKRKSNLKHLRWNFLYTYDEFYNLLKTKVWYTHDKNLIYLWQIFNQLKKKQTKDNILKTYEKQSIKYLRCLKVHKKIW